MKQFILLFIAIIGAQAQTSPPAIVIRPPDSSTATETQTARFTCAAYGLPPPDIAWTQANGDLADKIADANSGYKVRTETLIVNDVAFSISVLEICGVTAATADQYTCTATNGVPGAGVADSTASFSLVVGTATKQPAAIITMTTDSGVEYGSSVEAVCVAYGNPLPTITWDNPACFNCGSNLLRGNGSSTVTNQVVNYGDVAFVKSTLSLCGVEDADNGTYRCTATNGITGVGIADAVAWWGLSVSAQVVPSSTARPVETVEATTEQLKYVNERAYQGVVAFETILIIVLILVIVALVVLILIKSRSYSSGRKTEIPRPPKDPHVRKDGFENPLHGDLDDAVDVDTMTYADLAKKMDN